MGYGDAHGGLGGSLPLSLADNLRHFEADHTRFGISGGASGGVKQSHDGKGQATMTVGGSASAGKVYGRTETTADLIDINADGLPDRVERNGVNISVEVGREVTWNELDQLAKEVDSSYTNTYVYNSEGQRTHKRRTSLETVYVNAYYVIRNLLFQTKHIYAGATRIVSAVVTLNDYKKLTTTQTPILFYYHSDQLGSTGYITDRTGQILEHEEYLPSGESWIEELKNGSANNRLPWQFNAKELDENGVRVDTQAKTSHNNSYRYGSTRPAN